MSVTHIAVLVVALAGCAGGQQPPAAPPRVIFGWSELAARLPGVWQATTADGKVIRVTYRLVSGDSALVESFVTPSGRETISVFHPDGDGVVLTHYCAQGNQPRLRAVAAPAGTVDFRYLDATNLTDVQAVMTVRTLVFTPTGFDQTEVYRQPDGSEESTTLTFTRAPGV